MGLLEFLLYRSPCVLLSLGFTRILSDVIVLVMVKVASSTKEFLLLAVPVTKPQTESLQDDELVLLVKHVISQSCNENYSSGATSNSTFMLTLPSYLAFFSFGRMQLELM